MILFHQNNIKFDTCIAIQNKFCKVGIGILFIHSLYSEIVLLKYYLFLLFSIKYFEQEKTNSNL